MRVSAAEAESLAGGISMNRKSWTDRRAVILSCSFLVFFLALDWGTSALGSAAAGEHWHLTAGLSFALLLAYGPRYAPLVLVASLVNELWLHPSAISFPSAALQCLIMTLGHAVGAELFRARSGRPPVSLGLWRH